MPGARGIDYFVGYSATAQGYGPVARHANVAAQGQQPPAVGRIRRKMAVLLMSYSGTGYGGMQVQPTGGTIENELFDALLAVGAITSDNHARMQTAKFQRTARTDKGVHAARQVVSLKMAVDDPDIVEKLNSKLPEQIRIMTFMRAPRSFNCKNQCTGRRYQYLAPTYAFCPKDLLQLGTQGESPSETDSATARQYRIDSDTVQQIRIMLKRFVGTHNFHNFTSRLTFDDASANRYIKSFECSEPTMIDGIEFVTLTVVGQSFLLHMIRKMVGLTMAVVRGYVDQDVLDRAWGPEKVDIPRAPGLGLLLDACFFDVYNKKYKDDPEHPPMGWPELDGTIETFKRNFIFSEMVKTEKSEQVILTWLGTLANHSYASTEQRNEYKNVLADKAASDAGNGGSNPATTGSSQSKRKANSSKFNGRGPGSARWHKRPRKETNQQTDKPETKDDSESLDVPP